MLEYTPKAAIAELFGSFAVVIKGKRYEVPNFNFQMYEAFGKINEIGMTTEVVSELAIAIMGKDEFDATSPHNPLELQQMALWMSETFFKPLGKEDGEPKNVVI